MSWQGTAKGAATGASIGTAIMPGVGTAIGAGVGALGGALATKKTKFQKAQEDMLKADLERMQNGQLGLTDQQKQQMIGQAGEAAGRNIGAQQMQMGQLAAANPFAAAQLQSAARQGSAQVAQQGAQASLGADQLSQMMAEQEANRIRSQLSRQAENDQASAASKEAAIDEIGGGGAAVIDILKSSGLMDTISSVASNAASRQDSAGSYGDEFYVGGKADKLTKEERY